MSKFSKTVIFAALTLVFAITFASLSDFFSKCRTVRDNTVRLHVIANSDSESDQAIKLAVRDAIIEDFSVSSSKNEAEENIRGKLSQIVDAAQKTVYENGGNEPVRAELTRMYFDTKDYGSFTMPAGEYDALRIVIGDGAGKNWWCVMFPPLCLPAAQKDINTKEYFGDSSEILENSTKYKVRFAIVELYEKLIYKLRSVF